jgi:pimeloyl-ACP methyl ester carboxylesterase
MKCVSRIILFLAGGIFSLLIILIIILLWNSRGVAIPFADHDGKPVPGSISLIKTVNINGLNQRMIIRGRDTTNPVLLYLHGGPGDPEFPFVHYFNPGIEDMFVVCYWDQRGAGLSYSKDIPSSSFNLSQFVDDAGKVSEYLLHRFNHKKIYLLGHSWGSMLGAYTANKFPDYYYAFISVGQVGNQEKSEKISYEHVLLKAKELDDSRAIKALLKIGSPPYENPEVELDNMIVERKYVIKYGGAVKKGNFYPQAVKPLIFCREYTVQDKINYLRGMNLSKKYLWNFIMKTNLFRTIPSQKIPIYVIHGTSDYETSFLIAKEYFDSLAAPLKKFYPFDNSAHSPIFEEPEKFNRLLKEIQSEQKDTN